MLDAVQFSTLRMQDIGVEGNVEVKLECVVSLHTVAFKLFYYCKHIISSKFIPFIQVLFRTAYVSLRWLNRQSEPSFLAVCSKWTLLYFTKNTKKIHQIYQNACYIRFIESARVKYVNYTSREAEYWIKKPMRKRTRFFFRVLNLPRFINSISKMGRLIILFYGM